MLASVHARLLSPSAANAECGPDRAMGVLAAVFAHARHVAADIAGVQLGIVEGRIEQLDQPRVRPHAGTLYRIHGAA